MPPFVPFLLNLSDFHVAFGSALVLQGVSPSRLRNPGLLRVHRTMNDLAQNTTDARARRYLIRLRNHFAPDAAGGFPAVEAEMGAVPSGLTPVNAASLLDQHPIEGFVQLLVDAYLTEDFSVTDSMQVAIEEPSHPTVVPTASAAFALQAAGMLEHQSEDDGYGCCRVCGRDVEDDVHVATEQVTETLKEI